MGYTKISLKDTLKQLKQDLTQKRFMHSLGTAQYAKKLAVKYGLDSEKAYIAGLLHDCAKCYSEELMQEIMDKYLDVPQSERSSWKTWHAPVSAYIAKTVYGVKDDEILSAIRWHTVGKINMTDFEKIIFIADKVEFNTREDNYAQPIREQLENSLNKAMLLCYQKTIKSLVDRDLPICGATVDIYNNLLTNLIY